VGLGHGLSWIGVKRRWNWSLWTGFLFIAAGLFSYEYVARFPAMRDFPWLNLGLLGIGAVLLILGLVRAFGQPARYRGRVLGSVLAVLGATGIAFFLYIIFFVLRQVPPSTGAPRVGERAPSFTLPDQDGRPVSLTDVLSSAGTHATILIFYRGHW
jgi:hypothetical protein